MLLSTFCRVERAERIYAVQQKRTIDRTKQYRKRTREMEKRKGEKEMLLFGRRQVIG
jgi:hypothetical protein